MIELYARMKTNQQAIAEIQEAISYIVTHWEEEKKSKIITLDKL